MTAKTLKLNNACLDPEMQILSNNSVKLHHPNLGDAIFPIFYQNVLTVT